LLGATLNRKVLYVGISLKQPISKKCKIIRKN